MRTWIRPAWLALIALTILQRAAFAQTQPSTEEADAPPAWEISLAAYTYLVPGDHDYIQPTLRADNDWLHLEARFNYEDVDTTSLWVGYNWSIGDEVTFDFTAMIGGVVGETDGVAPGYEFTLAWKGLQLYSEAEYVFDFNDSSDSFFYTWSELTYAFTDGFRAGAVIQRTKAYDTDFDIQRGLIVGLTYKAFDLTACVLNPDDNPIFVVGLAYAY